LPIEESEFRHWRGIKALVDIVHDSERGVVPHYAAMSAIAQYNRKKGTLVTFEEVRDLDHTYIPCGAGEWVVWTDHQEGLLRGDYDDPYEAFTYANESVEWIIVLLPDSSVLVFRSPHAAGREMNKETANGLNRGDTTAYILPPEIEASVKQDIHPTMPDTVCFIDHIDNYPLYINPHDLHHKRGFPC